MIRLIAGLGNPGPEYTATRHNAGFWFVDEVAARLRVALAPERGYFGLAGRAQVGGRSRRNHSAVAYASRQSEVSAATLAP